MSRRRSEGQAVIQFICPNGHQLSAPDERAGRPGKCPKCGTAFVVPELDVEVAEVSVDASRSGSGKLVSAAVVEPSGGEELFFFLCPNGHKLNGPPSLKGRPGQCPHCGAKFRIPSDDDDDQGDQRSDFAARHADTSGAGTLDGVLVEGVELIDELDSIAPPPVGGHALGDLLLQLWEQRDMGIVIELVLKDGTIIPANYFSPRLSGAQYGVFAADEDNQQVILVVAWDDIARFAIRNVSQLPDRFF